MCVRILRREASHLGVRSAFSVYDADDTRRLVGLVTRDLELDPKKYAPRAVAAQISNLKNELIDAEGAAARATNDHEKKVAEVYRVYQARLRTANAFDFDDLIMETVALLQRLPAVAEYYRRRFRHVLVDEYQDTNHAQYVLVRELVAPADEGVPPGELCVVGDSDQSIYAFRGASIRNIVEFEQDFPDARTILLEQNYRSTQSILSAANAVIARNTDRRDKRLWTDRAGGEKVVGYVADNEHDEAAFVAAEIDRLVDSGEARNSDVAVFYRTNSQSRVFEDVFLRVGLPYKVVGGVRFYERREVRDALAYLRVLANPDDTVSLRRILNVPKRGIGDRAEELVATYADRERISFAAGLRVAAQRPDRIPGLVTRSQRCIAAFVDILDGLDELVQRGESTAELLEAVYARTGYTAELEASEDPQDASRLDNLAELVTVAREFAGDAAVADLAVEPEFAPEPDPGVPEPGSLAAVPGAGGAGRRRRLHPGRRGRHGHPDDPAHRQGPGVPGGLPDRLGGRGVPAHAGHGRPGRAGRGAPAGLRRDHPRPAPALPVPGDDPLHVRPAQRQPGLPVPR
jgi:DNA helicase-2/ATP-dependent DNA helicase PcrA